MVISRKEMQLEITLSRITQTQKTNMASVVFSNADPVFKCVWVCARAHTRMRGNISLWGVCHHSRKATGGGEKET